MPYLRDVYECLKAQTMPDWEWLLMTHEENDREALPEAMAMAGIPQGGNIRIFHADSPDRATIHPMCNLFNTFFPMARGEFLFDYSDDDLISDDCFQTFTEFFDKNPMANAAYVSLQHEYTDGVNANRTYWIKADRPRRTGLLDGHVDGSQVCIRKMLLDKVPPPWWPETTDRAVLRHADGMYIEKMAQAAMFFPAGNVNKAYVVHRFTPVSSFTTNTGQV